MKYRVKGDNIFKFFLTQITGVKTLLIEKIKSITLIPSPRKSAESFYDHQLFYLFTGIHSIHSGLFIFYIPIFLWLEFHSFAFISLFIGIAGIFFTLSLRVFEHILSKYSLPVLLLSSFLFPSICFFFFLLGIDSFFYIVSIMYGTYMCWYYTLHRILFIHITTQNTTGKTFGSFQVFVFLILKATLLISAFFLEKESCILLFFLSLLFSCIGMIFFYFKSFSFQKAQEILHYKIISFKKIRYFLFHSSGFMFVIDGIFLYLESFFWVITLYFIANGNFIYTAALIVILSFFFAIIHWLLKNKIDHISGHMLFQICVFLYAGAWVIRSFIIDISSFIILSIGLVVVTFSTVLFRLTLHKRFYDNARKFPYYEYMIAKSYITQFSLSLFFLLMSLFLFHNMPDMKSFDWFYLVFAMLSLGYLRYKKI